MKSLFTLSILFLATVLHVFAQNSKKESDEILGIWLTGTKKGKVEIYKCGNKYCGKLVWLKEPTYEDGSPKRDKKNPDEKLQGRLLMGMNILTGFEYDEDLEWEDGEIYDPESGKTYSCLMYIDEDDKGKLCVRGYIGFSLIGRTEFWVRSSLD